METTVWHIVVVIVLVALQKGFGEKEATFIGVCSKVNFERCPIGMLTTFFFFHCSKSERVLECCQHKFLQTLDELLNRDVIVLADGIILRRRHEGYERR